MIRRPVHRRWVPALLIAGALGIGPAAAGSIYYKTEKDGSVRLTNAPDGGEYRTYLTGAAAGLSPSSVPVTGPYADQISSAASQYGVDPHLVRAVIATESNFNPRAISRKGARGLMQLMPATADRFGVKNIEDPHENIHAGVRYLRYLLDLFGGDLVLALAAYNAGERVVQDVGRVPNYRETRQYVDKVLNRYGRRGPDGGERTAGRTGRAAPRAQIYRAVSSDGSLVFSDSPIRPPEPDKD